jgi:tetratricopeptide (TPR) repeat protein
MKKQISKVSKFKKLINQVEESLTLNNIDDALSYLLLALNIEPNNHAILNEIGTCYAKKQQYEAALSYHLKAFSIIPNDSIVLSNIAFDFYYLEKYSEALGYFKLSLEIDQNNLAALSGIVGTYHATGDNTNLYSSSIKGITLFPKNYIFHLNLGIALLHLEKLDDARYCFETALILNPQSVEAEINKAVILTLEKNYLESISIYEKIINKTEKLNPPLADSIKFNLSFDYLITGQLKKGWHYYQYGFSKLVPTNKRRKPERYFVAPEWNGELLNDKVLMVWREQGLGDEILFLSMIPDLLSITQNVIIECDIRLTKIISNSFPTLKVRPPPVNSDGSVINEDFDYQIPMGSLTKFLRLELSDFNENGKYLNPVAYINSEVDDLFNENIGQVFVGISWRSGQLTTERNKYYIPLNEWEEILKIPNIIFINLQYGNCENELLEVENHLKIKIHRWKDIDLKDDLDAVFSIISRLDLVVTAMTAVAHMAYSVGVETLTYSPAPTWTSLGTSEFPWSKHMRLFIPKQGFTLKDTINDISKYIQENHNVKSIGY